MKTSIKVQMATIIISLLAGTIILCWFINSTFLEGYYEWDKEKIVRTAYEMLNEAGDEEGAFSEDFQTQMREYAFRHNLSLEVIDPNAQVVFEASFNGAELKRRLFAYIMGRGTDIHLDQIPEQNTLFRLHEIRTNTEYMEMYGTLDNGCWYIISSTMESIKDSVKLANRFLAYIGVGAVLIGCIVCFWITSRFTKPILKLAEISAKMTQLDFEAKYQGKEKNEIALLGANINKLSESLEKNISELKTANNELKKDIEKKEEIDEMRKEFLSNVSHELKTPLALIQGYAEGLKEAVNDDPESREYYCDVIMDEANKMNTMVKRLLTLNQLESGNDVVTMERFDVASLVSNYLQMAGILIKQNDVRVKYTQTEPVYVWADEFKTEEVFMNYFTNAMNHCGGERVIEVKITKENGKACVHVFNTGEPIPEDAIAHIWEKFYKVDKARTREYGGSGVGLSIVKAIMDSMNQKYGVENYVNGVRFWFELELVIDSFCEGS